jgi:tetratricopeptide (TPR) repeat protein
MSQPLTLRFILCWLLVLVASADGLRETPELAECTRAFYRGEFAQAAQLAQKHLRTHPHALPLRLMLARALLAQGKFQPAFEELRQVLGADPNNTDALYYLSLIARELSQREYQRLLALAPDSDRAHQLLAEAALAAENPSQAETEFQLALRANPRSIEAALGLADLKRSQSKFDEAIGYYTQAEKTGPLSYPVAYGLGACYTYKKDYSQAADWLRKAVALAPDSAAGHFALGNALFQGGQLEAALPELKASLQLEPRMKQAYFLLGRDYSKLGRQEEAQAAFQKLDQMNRSEVPGAGAKPAPDGSPERELPQ